MHHLSSGESSKPPSSQKENLLLELEETKRSLMQNEEDTRQLVARMKRLKDTQERENKEQKWEPRRAIEHYMKYASQEEEEDWRVTTKNRV